MSSRTEYKPRHAAGYRPRHARCSAEPLQAQRPAHEPGKHAKRPHASLRTGHGGFVVVTPRSELPPPRRFPIRDFEQPEEIPLFEGNKILIRVKRATNRLRGRS